jgi:hypothetical protein
MVYFQYFLFSFSGQTFTICNHRYFTNKNQNIDFQNSNKINNITAIKNNTAFNT